MRSHGTPNRGHCVVVFGILLVGMPLIWSRRGAASAAPPSTAAPSLRGSGGSCAVDLGEYPGELWTKPGETRDRRCLVRSPRLRVDLHERALDDGSVVRDWLWLDYGDRVNALARRRDGSFVVFEQSKYALEGASLAVVGGFIEPGEEPAHAAAREVREEARLACAPPTPLGRFRTDVNRGLGWVHGFLLSDCVHDESTLEPPIDADQERQEARTLSLAELEAAAGAGRFVEVQWSNTVALALLRLRARGLELGSGAMP